VRGETLLGINSNTGVYDMDTGQNSNNDKTRVLGNSFSDR